MNEKEVLVRIVDIKNDYMIRAEYTSIPSEMLKMYHYMKDKDGLFLNIEQNPDKPNSRYDDNITCSVKEVEVVPGGDETLNCINVYVEVF